MMGPWSIFGNHHFGGTVFLYDGAPDYPAPDRLWRMIERHGITTFGVSPTAIRMLMRDDSARDFPMKSLRLLGSTGEPWDETSYRWFFENVGKHRCPVINISGGTEIIGCFLAAYADPATEAVFARRTGAGDGHRNPRWVSGMHEASAQA